MKIELDRTDIELIKLLRKHARLSNKELAARVKLAESSCHERVKRLVQRGAALGVCQQAAHPGIAPVRGIQRLGSLQVLACCLRVVQPQVDARAGLQGLAGRRKPLDDGVRQFQVVGVDVIGRHQGGQQVLKFARCGGGCGGHGGGFPSLALWSWQGRMCPSPLWPALACMGLR